MVAKAVFGPKLRYGAQQQLQDMVRRRRKNGGDDEDRRGWYCDLRLSHMHQGT